MWKFDGQSTWLMLKSGIMMYLLCSFFKHIFLFCSRFDGNNIEQTKNGLPAPPADRLLKIQRARCQSSR